MAAQTGTQLTAGLAAAEIKAASYLALDPVRHLMATLEADGTPILASMSGLGHYMQEASRAGVQLHNYVTEGNGDLWSATIRAPRDHVGWVRIEEANDKHHLRWTAPAKALRAWVLPEFGMRKALIQQQFAASTV